MSKNNSIQSGQIAMLALLMACMLALLNAATKADPTVGADSDILPNDNANCTELQLLWDALNDCTTPVDDRIAAEHRLIASRSLCLLPLAFRGLYEPVVLCPELDRIAAAFAQDDSIMPELARSLYRPATGSPEFDAMLGVQPATSIAYARHRIWLAVAQQAEPEAERHSIFEQLLNEWHELPAHVHDREAVFRDINSAVRSNWTPGVRAFMLRIYQDTSAPVASRYGAGHTLIDMTGALRWDDRADIIELLIATPWAERGSEFAHRMGERLHYADDPRVAALKIDNYLMHQAQPAMRHRGAMLANDFDRYFGGISGVVRGTNQVTDEDRQRIAEDREIQREAVETGDYSKLKAFRQARAQREAELVVARLERIDAWIKQNRERIESEAVRFHSER